MSVRKDVEQRALELSKIFPSFAKKEEQQLIATVIKSVETFLIEQLANAQQTTEILQRNKAYLTRMFGDVPNLLCLSAFTTGTIAGRMLEKLAEQHRQNGEFKKEKVCIDAETGNMTIFTPFVDVTSPRPDFMRMRREHILNETAASKRIKMDVDTHKMVLDIAEKKKLVSIKESLNHDPTGFTAMDIIVADFRMNLQGSFSKETYPVFAIAGAELASNCYKSLYPLAVSLEREGKLK